MYDVQGVLKHLKHLRFNPPKLGVPTPLEYSINIINGQKWGKFLIQTMSNWDSKGNSID